MQIKDIFYLELCKPFFSVEQNHLCNFARRHHEEQFCEIILKLDLCFRKCLLKIFLSGALEALLFSGIFYAILVEGLLRINSVKLF